MSRKDHPIAAIRAANKHTPQFGGQTHAAASAADEATKQAQARAAATWDATHADADEQAAERANLQAKADRLRDLTAPTLPLPEVTELDVEHFLASPAPDDLGDGWEPEPTPTPPAAVAMRVADKTGRPLSLDATESALLNVAIRDAALACADDDGLLTPDWLHQGARDALANGDFLAAAAFAVLLARHA